MQKTKPEFEFSFSSYFSILCIQQFQYSQNIGLVSFAGEVDGPCFIGQWQCKVQAGARLGPRLGLGRSIIFKSSSINIAVLVSTKQLDVGPTTFSQ